MSAELLRRAAAKLREHAERATLAPWQAAEHEGEWSVDGDIKPADHAWLADMRFGEQQADAEYIALMHPPVALALADWLDSEAQLYAPNKVGFAVARAILREEP